MGLVCGVFLFVLHNCLDFCHADITFIITAFGLTLFFFFFQKTTTFNSKGKIYFLFHVVVMKPVSHFCFFL